MNKLFHVLEQAIGPSHGIPQKPSHPLSYVPEECGCDDKNIDEQAIGLSPGPSAAVTGGGLELDSATDGRHKHSDPGWPNSLHNLEKRTTNLDELTGNEHVDQLPGGLADGSRVEDFDPNELEMGIEIEQEHTPNKDMAREIAMDHLKEIPDYYTRLKKMEDQAESEGAMTHKESYTCLETLILLQQEHHQYLIENDDVYMDFEDYMYVSEGKLRKKLNKLKKAGMKPVYYDLETTKVKWAKYGIGTLIGADASVALTRAALSPDAKTAKKHVGASVTQNVAGLAGAAAATRLSANIAAKGALGLTGSIIAQLPVGAIYTWWYRKVNDKCRVKCNVHDNKDVCYNNCYIRASGMMIGKIQKDLNVVSKAMKKEKGSKKLKSLAKLQHKMYKQISFYRKKQEGYRKDISKIKAKQKKTKEAAKVKKAKARAKAKKKKKK